MSKSNLKLSVADNRGTSKKYNIMAFNEADKVNCSTWTQASMEKDMSACLIYEEPKMPESGAGSEFGKKQRAKSPWKKVVVETCELKADDQPWILQVNGKDGKRFKGQSKGKVTENASYYIFMQCADGAFEAFLVNRWYNFTPQSRHRTLTAEEAEKEWSRRNKVVNHFSIMLQRRLCEEDEEGEKPGEKKKKKKKARGRVGNLRIHDLEEEVEMSNDSDCSVGDDAESKKKPTKNIVKRKGKKRKSKENSEALEDSDDGDYEGLEVDYMSEDSSSEEELEHGKPNKGEELPKGIDEASESEEEEVKEAEEEEEEEGKTPGQLERKTKKDSSNELDNTDESDIEEVPVVTSALFTKKCMPPKRGGGRSSAGSPKRGRCLGRLSIDSAVTSNTLPAAASNLEQDTPKILKDSQTK